MRSALTLQNVTKLYRNGRGITDINLSVEQGEVFGFLGPNGAGKTTTIRCVMDFIRPQQGTIMVGGYPIQSSTTARHEAIGYIPADPQLYAAWTGSEHLAFYQRLGKPKDVSQIVELLELPMDVPFQQLSTGNKQKLAVLLAFASEHTLMIFDEPTKGLDPLLQQVIYDLIRDYRTAGGAVFVSSHNLPEVEKICDRVGVIKEGRIVADETMQHLRNLSVHLVTAVTAKAIPIQLLPKDAEVLHHKSNHILLKVRGNLNPIISVLSKQKLKDLEITHANLEESFMEYYK